MDPIPDRVQDGESAADVRVAFDDEVTLKHEWVGRGAGLLPRETARCCPALAACADCWAAAGAFLCRRISLQPDAPFLH